MRSARVLVSEDDAATLDLFAIALDEDGCACERFTALERLSDALRDLLVDAGRAGREGVEPSSGA